MKKKIVVSVFLLLILLTVIATITGAVDVYHQALNDNAPNGFPADFEMVIILVIGGFVVFCEMDLFCTAYYLFLKPKTVAKTILHISANITLLLVFFTNTISHFLFRYVSAVFGEELIVLFGLLLTYVILRVICIAYSVIKK